VIGVEDGGVVVGDIVVVSNGGVVVSNGVDVVSNGVDVVVGGGVDVCGVFSQTGINIGSFLFTL